MTLIEASFSEWEEWFTKNRSTNFSVLTTLDINLEAVPQLIRLFTPQDGKVPKKGIRIDGTIWATRNVKPIDNIVVLYSRDSAPLVLCPPEKIPLLPQARTRSESTQRLTPPFLWRCRVCSTTGQSESLMRHCGEDVRQLAHVSEETKLWFKQFLDDATFAFIPSNELQEMQGMVLDREKIEIAIQAGSELQQLISDLDLSCPSTFEVYTPMTDHIRVSDLKKKGGKGRGMKGALNSAITHIDKLVPPRKTAPKGGSIEIGHVFDELFDDITNSINSNSWKKGEKVMFNCTELGLCVTGTPDLDYKGIPVEMKTIKSLFVKGENSTSNNKNTYKSKWKSNYLPQLAMYSDARNMEWMLLLLIAKNSGRFSVIPVNPKAKLAELRKEWKEWTKDKGLMDKLERYLEANPSFRI